MKKKNNKGFSLIELIIAIAILVILTGLLAPQFMRYMEKSRESKDMQVLDTIYSAVQTALAEEGAYTEIKENIATTETDLATLVGAGMSIEDIMATSGAFAEEVGATLGSIDVTSTEYPGSVWSSKAVTEALATDTNGAFVQINPDTLQVSVWVGQAASGTDNALQAADVLGDALSGNETAGTIFRIVK